MLRLMMRTLGFFIHTTQKYNTSRISTTIIAPTFLAAANFIILGTIINHVGAQYSRLPATYCTSFVLNSLI